jgi:hypothetical protein
LPPGLALAKPKKSSVAMPARIASSQTRLFPLAVDRTHCRDAIVRVVVGGEQLIDAGIRRVQPPDAVHSAIAGIVLYMRDAYGFRLGAQDQQASAAWNNADPPDAWEIERNARVARAGKDE